MAEQAHVTVRIYYTKHVSSGKPLGLHYCVGEIPEDAVFVEFYIGLYKRLKRRIRYLEDKYEIYVLDITNTDEVVENIVSLKKDQYIRVKGSKVTIKFVMYSILQLSKRYRIINRGKYVEIIKIR